MSYLLTSRNFEDIRNHLFSNNFFVQRLILSLRKKLKLPKNGLKDLNNIFEWEKNIKNSFLKNLNINNKKVTKLGSLRIKKYLNEETFLKEKLYAPIYDALEKFKEFNLSFELLKSLVLGISDFYFSGSSLVTMVTSFDDPIREQGVYIKYTPNMPDIRLKELKKQAEEATKTLNKIIYDKKLKKLSYRKDERIPSDDAIEIYKSIEQELVNKYLNKSYVFEKIVDVIKRIAVNKNIKYANTKRLYYQVQNVFNLPGISEVSKI